MKNKITKLLIWINRLQLQLEWANKASLVCVEQAARECDGRTVHGRVQQRQIDGAGRVDGGGPLTR